MQRLSVTTTGKQKVVDITDTVQSILDAQEAPLHGGVMHCQVLHTTAALSTADLDPGTDKDILEALREIVPGNEHMQYRHPHNPEHTPDHILSTLVGTDVSIPVEKGKLILGTWQRVILLEFDGPRERTIIVTSINTDGS